MTIDEEICLMDQLVVYMPPRNTDLCLSLVALRLLISKLSQESHHGSQICLLFKSSEQCDFVESYLKDFLSRLPHIDVVFECHAKHLKQRNFDCALMFDRSFRSAFDAWKRRCKKIVGFSCAFGAFFYTDHVVVKEGEGEPQFEHFVQVVRTSLNLQEIYFPEFASLQRDSTVATLVVGLSLSPSHVTQRLEVAEYAKLCETLIVQGAEVWLMGDESAEDLSAQVMSLCSSLLVQKKLLINPSLLQRSSEIRKLHVLVTSHLEDVQLASDLQIPVVALMGAEIKNHGFSPWQKNASQISVSGSCAGCESLCFEDGSRKKHTCTSGMTAQRIYREVRRFSDQLS